MGAISWSVAAPVAICAIVVQAGCGLAYVWLVWPGLRARPISELLLLPLFVSTPLLLAGALIALLGGQPGDLAIAVACCAMWAGQAPFVLAGAPLLDWWLDRERRLVEKGRGLAEVRDGQT